MRGQKLEKLLSNHEAQNKSGAIYGTIVVFLFNQYSPYFNDSVVCFWKAAYPSGGVDISTPHRWRGDWLHDHGDGVYHVFFAFLCGLIWSLLLVVCRWVRENNLKMGVWVWQSGPLRLAPYQRQCMINVIILYVWTNGLLYHVSCRQFNLGLCTWNFFCPGMNTPPSSVPPLPWLLWFLWQHFSCQISTGRPCGCGCADPYPTDLFHNMLRMLGVNIYWHLHVCWSDIVWIVQTHIDANGNHDTACTVNMAQVSNAALVSDQGYCISNWYETHGLNDEAFCWVGAWIFNRPKLRTPQTTNS